MKKADEVRRGLSAHNVAHVIRRQECPSDEGDLSQQSHEEWLFLNRNTLEIKLLREVEDAVRRIDQGVYGICAECEEPISEKRLAALPWARYCVKCQELLASGPGAYENEPQEAGR